jgi:hypothetical protein
MLIRTIGHSIQRMTEKRAGCLVQQRLPANSGPASSGERAQVGPSVAAMKFTALTIEPYSTKRLIEAVRWIRRITEEHHRGHATVKEPPRDGAQQKAAETLTLNRPEQVDLVEFASVTRQPTVVRCAPRKTYQLAEVVLDDVANVLPSLISNT